ncbi:MAG: dihydroorotate dehydrogenase electron transfer subunit [Candidatus Woesearchaeota archaeon]
MNELPVMLKIEEVIVEAEGIRSFLFKHKLDAKPGQFLMVWLPGIGAKPFGISYYGEGGFGITVCNVGEVSGAIHKLKKGDLLGIMGPYGSSFSLEGKRIMLIAGGYGAAPLFPLAEEAKRKGIALTFVIGAKSANKLIYRQRAQKASINTVFTTDDGSFGRKCFASEILEELLKNGGIEKVFACGPEPMLKRVAELCQLNKVKCEVSLERYIKCGFGVCGSCCVDDSGVPLCKIGPVLSGEKALSIKEFGQYHRDGSGTRHYFGK